jgi:hypothetical protein
MKRRRAGLFLKYFGFIGLLVSVGLVASGAIGLYSSYQETRNSLANLQHEKTKPVSWLAHKQDHGRDTPLSRRAPALIRSRRPPFILWTRRHTSADQEDIAAPWIRGLWTVRLSRQGVSIATALLRKS